MKVSFVIFAAVLLTCFILINPSSALTNEYSNDRMLDKISAKGPRKINVNIFILKNYILKNTKSNCFISDTSSNKIYFDFSFQLCKMFANL